MNAIILAAGMGTRLRPLTNDIPKCLVPVCGTPMIERQIYFLHEAGIKDIIVVSGYQAKRLDYLRSKYGVQIVYNEQYDTCNNIYSLYKVINSFGDSWVVEGDVYIHENCFTRDINKSTYFAKWHPHYDNEWGLVTDASNRLISINIGSGEGLVMSGISYWTDSVSEFIRNDICMKIDRGGYSNLFWDDSVVKLYRSQDIYVERFDDIYEIDTVQELQQVESLLNRANYMKTIANSY